MTVRLGFHHDLNCPTASASAASGNVTWLWSSPRFLPCATWSLDPESGCAGGEQQANVSVSGLSLATTAVEPSALAVHFDNGDHNLALALPLNISLAWQ